MAISVETLALARKYADAVAAAGSKEALDKAVEEAVRQSKAYTNEAIAEFTSFKVQIVESLPLSDIDTHTIYFLRRKTPSGEADYFYEYMYINNLWELIGSTELDLSGYWTSEEVKEYVASKQYSLPKANKTTLGGVKIDGESIAIDDEGTIYVVDDYTEDTAADVAQDLIDNNFSSIKTPGIEDLFK